jgi:hypothetical protein
VTIKIAHAACSLLVAASILGLADRAVAVPISAQFAVSVNGADPGLVLQTADVASNPYVGNLALGVPVTFDLFRIWTEETAVNLAEDNIFKPATVQWSFASQVGPAVSAGFTHGSTFFGIFDAGRIYWGSPTVVTLANGAQVAISLSEEIFNASSLSTIFFDLTPGIAHGANVEATFLLLREPRPVPEPTALSLGAVTIIGLLAARRRRLARPLAE